MARKYEVFGDCGLHNRRVRTFAVIGIMVVAGLFVAGSLVAGHSTSRGSTSRLNVALPPGDYISFTCLHSVIISGGSVLCKDQSGNSLDMCDSSVCTYSLSGGADNGYIFSNWTATGDAFFGTSGSGCSSSQFST